jgi:hypothetical protein
MDAMRLVAGALALTLFASFARAEGPANPAPTRPSSGSSHGKIPLRVVRVMPESHQALLFDRSRSTHVLVEVGSKIDGYTVEDIDDDEVTLQIQGKQIVLAAPARSNERRTDRGPQGVRVRSVSAARPGDSRTADPQADDSQADDARATDPGADDPPAADGESGDAQADDRAADTRPSHRRPAHRRATAARSANNAGDPAPVDPYGEPPVRVVRAPGATGEPPAAGPTSGSLDPGEGPGEGQGEGPGEGQGEAQGGGPGKGGVRVVQAPGSENSSAAPSEPRNTSPATRPIEPGDDGVRVAEAPGASTAARSAAPAADHKSRIRVAQAPTTARSTGDQQTLSARAMADVLTGGMGARDGRKPTSSLFAARAADAPTAPGTASGSAPSVSNPSSSAPSVSSPSAPSSASASPATDARANAAAPTARDARSAPAPAAATGEAVLLSRGEVEAALADFARLTASIRGSFSASGVVVDGVGEGTLFQRAGLRAGDVIAAVDGTRLRSLDDAANVYARAAKATAMSAQIVRGGKPMTLHVAIR